MNNWRQMMSMILAVCLVQFCLADSLRAATPFTPGSVREQLDQLGVGARLALKLAGGEKMTGSIESLENDSLVFAPDRNSGPRRISYEQVAQVKLAKSRYKASGQPDPMAARRVVLALGVGKHIVVNTVAGREFHGHIQAIEADHLTMLPDHQTAPVQVAYSDVRHVEKNLSFGATVVLVVLIVAAVVVAASVAATR